jgi:AcrR family transcriptional regulator
MITVANRDEYAGASVSAVVAEAKISKPTFYEYFQDRDGCFIAALNSVLARVLDAVRGAVEATTPELAAVAGVRAMLEFASSEPPLARFMTNEPLAGGQAILDARDEGIDAIAEIIEARLKAAPPDAPTPDLPVKVVIGGLHRLLGARVGRGQRLTDSEVEDLLRWLTDYNVPREECRWQTMQASTSFATPPKHSPSSLRAPEPLPPGRPTLSEADVAANQRLRIIFAAAKLADERGYAGVTVAEIARLAQVDLRVFYSLFAKKQDVFVATAEHGFQEGVAITAGAFFNGESWPERLWEMGAAFLLFLEANPHFARIGFIESYAAGRSVAQRSDDNTVAFTIFLQEGLQYSAKATPPGRIALEALTTCYFDNLYRQLRASRSPRLIGLLPNIVSLWLTPFLGPSETNRFIDGKTGAKSAKDRSNPSG